MTTRKTAQAGLEKIKSAVVDLLKTHSYGLTNDEISAELGLESDQNGKQKNYLAWSVLGILMNEGLVERTSHRKDGVREEIYRPLA